MKNPTAWALHDATPPEVLEHVLFIDKYLEGTLTVEIAVKTAGILSNERANVIRQWAIDTYQHHVENLGKLLVPFIRYDSIGLWVTVGFYCDDNPTA